MRDTTARTAIHRKAASVPMRWLQEQGLVTGRALDYGCGHGKDALTYGLESYDYNWKPEMPEGKFDTITCIYVLNTRTRPEREAIIGHVLSKLAPNGLAYFAVRRDKLKAKGQYVVKLKAPVVYERKGAFVVYQVRRNK